MDSIYQKTKRYQIGFLVVILTLVYAFRYYPVELEVYGIQKSIYYAFSSIVFVYAYWLLFAQLSLPKGLYLLLKIFLLLYLFLLIPLFIIKVLEWQSFDWASQLFHAFRDPKYIPALVLLLFVGKTGLKLRA